MPIGVETCGSVGAWGVSKAVRNQGWLRQRLLQQKDLTTEQAKIEQLVINLAEELNIKALTKPAFFGKVTVSPVYRNGEIIGLDYSVEGTVRTS